MTGPIFESDDDLPLSNFAPHAGAWIETPRIRIVFVPGECRPPRGGRGLKRA
jgi:hypothetical protein